MKKIVLLLFLIICISNSANSANYITCEEAMESGEPFVLYLHSNGCAACKHFTPIFNEVMKRNSYNVVDVNFSYPQEDNECSRAESRTIPAVYVVNPQQRTRSKIKYETYYDDILFVESLNKLMAQ